MMKNLLLIAITCFFVMNVNAQSVGVNNTGAAPDASAALDVEATDKGVLLPRVALTATNVAAPVTAPATSLLVYNTATTAGANAVMPGYYFWDGTMWVTLNNLPNPTLSVSGDSIFLSGSNGVQIPVVYDGDTSQTNEIQTLTPNGNQFTLSGGGGTITMYDGDSSETNELQMLTISSDTIYLSNGGYVKLPASGGGQTLSLNNDSLTLSPGGGSVNLDYWKLTGNDSLDANVNFLGTTDSVDLVFKVNNLRKGFIGKGENSNIFFGIGAGTNAYSDRGVIGIGSFAANNLFNNQAYGNIAIGEYAFYQAERGSKNTVVGTGAMRAVTNGLVNDNTAIGERAGSDLLSGSYNVFVGQDAGGNVTGGSENIFIGGAANGTGSPLATVAIGFLASAGANRDRGVAIGHASSNTANLQVRIGSSSISSIGGYRAWTNLSDARLKSNIVSNVPGVDFIMKLRPVTYNMTLEDNYNLLYPEGIPEEYQKIIDQDKDVVDKVVRTGFIAQEVEAAAESLNFDFSGIDKPKNDKDFYGLRYATFVVPLVKATQEQQATIVDQQAQIEKLEERLKKLEQIILDLNK